jgi:Fur family transcriptional regulator, ferric uptake regulator
MDDRNVYLSNLRSLGYRLTPQRLVILRILEENQRHLTPGEIFEQARRLMPGLTEPTVYRSLNFLSAHGLILVTHVGGGQLVYEHAQRDHHHLICQECSQMCDVEPELLSELYLQFKVKTGFEIKSRHITFFGLCPHCQPDN